MIWTMEIPGWMPTPLNKLMRHWAEAKRLKDKDKAMIASAALVYGVTAATSKRRVSLRITLPPKQRAVDPDALWKSACDALVCCGILKNDSHLWVELVQPKFSRGDELVTHVTIEELP